MQKINEKGLDLDTSQKMNTLMLSVKDTLIQNMETTMKWANIIDIYSDELKIALYINHDIMALIRIIEEKHNLSMNQKWAISYITKICNTDASNDAPHMMTTYGVVR